MSPTWPAGNGDRGFKMPIWSGNGRIGSHAWLRRQPTDKGLFFWERPLPESPATVYLWGFFGWGGGISGPWSCFLDFFHVTLPTIPPVHINFFLREERLCECCLWKVCARCSVLVSQGQTQCRVLPRHWWLPQSRVGDPLFRRVL